MPWCKFVENKHLATIVLLPSFSTVNSFVHETIIIIITLSGIVAHFAG